jgi:ceramide glucosyltransferase
MATTIETITALLTFGGLVYMLLALWGARDYTHSCRRMQSANADAAPFAPDVSILKPVKGVDARMYAGFVSHCVQRYAGNYEIVFGVGSVDDPAVAEIDRLRQEFPTCAIRLVECPEKLGTSGKISNLVQMLREARHPFVIVNDSDILVSPNYLTHVMGPLREPHVGMVTAPYLGRTAEGGNALTLWSRLEALGISTDFLPGVLTSRMLEGGIHFGLGSTLAMPRTVLDQIGGFGPLLEALSDDYELGARIARAGYRIHLSGERVETTVPAYAFRGFWDHQLRWARSVRDSRRLGYLGLGMTYCLPWAILNCIASGFALWSFTLLSLVLLARVAVALSVGVGILRDEQVLRDLSLLPLRDFFGLLFWAWSFASDTIVWRGEHFNLRNGRISRS